MTELALRSHTAFFDRGFDREITAPVRGAAKKLSLNISKVIFSGSFRLLVITAMFLSLIIDKIALHSIGVSVRYLYLIVITLAGIWFGLKGGLAAATLATLVFIAEAYIFRDWSFRDLVVHGAYFRLTVFFLGGLAVGYISEAEKKLKERLRDLAYKDELTGCVNYRWTINILENEIERSERYNKEMSIIIIDIDHFKEVNDTYGHLIGNDTLKAFVDMLKSNIRTIDTIGRYGGEEFIIIFPEKNSADALIAVERIREKLSQFHVTDSRFKRSLDVSLRFSAGIACFPLNGKSLEALLDMADKALYRAKNSGRNRTVVENRRWERFNPALNIRIELLDPSGKNCLRPLEVKDISKRGVLLVFPEDIPAGELFLRIRFPEEEFISEFKCKVVHKRNEKGLCYAGVNFIDIPVEIENKIANCGARLTG